MQGKQGMQGMSRTVDFDPTAREHRINLERQPRQDAPPKGIPHMSAHFVRRLAALALLAGLPPTASAGTPVAAKHVILIMMENRGTDAIFGNKSSAPYIKTVRDCHRHGNARSR